MKSRRVFYAVTILYWLALYMYIPILSPYVQHLGGSLQMVGLVVGSYGFTQILLRIPLGILSDKIGKRKVFIGLGTALGMVSAIGMGVSSSAWMVLAFRALSGAAAATWVLYTVLFSSYFPPEEAPKAMGVIMFYSTIAHLIGTTLGGFTADGFGWQAPFVLAGVVGALGLIVSTQVQESKTINTQPVKIGQLLQVGRDPLLLKVSGLCVLFQAVQFSTVWGFTPSYAASIGASGSQLGILALISTLPAAYSALRSGQWAERLGSRTLLMVCFLLMAVFSAVTPFINSMALLYVTQGFNGLGRGAIFPLLMGKSIQAIPGEKRATAMGFFQSIYALGMFSGPVIVGLVSESLGYVGGFLSVGLMGLAGAVLTGFLLGTVPVVDQQIHNT